MPELFVYQTGPLGRNVVIDSSGFLVTNGDPAASGYPFAFGPLGRAICVDASGRLILSALSVGLGGGVGGGSGETNTASNLGSASGLFAGKSGVDLRFYSLRPGPNISIALSGNAYTLSSTGGGSGETNTASNLGAGSGLFAQKSSVDLQFKSLVPGQGIGIVGSATELLIGMTPSGTMALYNTGTRTVSNASTDQHTILAPSVGTPVYEGFIGKVTLVDESSLGVGDVTVKIYNDFARNEPVYERIFDLAQTPLTDFLPAYFISASGGAMYVDIVNNAGQAGDFSVQARVSTVLSVPTANYVIGSGLSSDNLASNPGLELVNGNQLRVKVGDGVQRTSNGVEVDSTVVRTTTDQNIAGQKRFSDSMFGITPAVSAGPPTSGTYYAGDMYLDSNKDFYQCTASGVPGTWQFWGWRYTQGISLGESGGQDNTTYTGTIPIGSSSGITIDTGISVNADGGRRGIIRKFNVWVSNAAHASGVIDIPFRIICYPNENLYGREQLWSIAGQGRKISLTQTITGGVDNQLYVDNVDKAAADDLVRVRRLAATVGEEYARLTARDTGLVKYTVDEALLNSFNKGDPVMVVTEFVELPWLNNSAIPANRNKIYIRIFNDSDTFGAIFGYELDIENIGGGPSIS